MELSDLIEEYRNHKNMGSWEGSRGFENLCKLVRAIGYRDPLNQLQFKDGCVGDLMCFFEDNSGAIEAVVRWIEEENNTEWKENIESELPELGKCPACGESLQDDVCQNPECDS